MRALPAAPVSDETTTPWSVREVLLDTGRDAACQLGRWQDALDLNTGNLTSLLDRGAPPAEFARSAFSDYTPLLRLGRTDVALAMLRKCREIFQDARDIRMLGKTLAALADTEDKRGHGDVAIGLERDALRYAYLARDVAGIAVSYHNLGNYLRRHARGPAPALACHLAADLIVALTGAGGAGQAVGGAAADLRDFGAAATPPADVADLCRRVGDIPGTDLARLLEALTQDPATAEQALRELIAQARALSRVAARPGP